MQTHWANIRIKRQVCKHKRFRPSNDAGLQLQWPNKLPCSRNSPDGVCTAALSDPSHAVLTEGPGRPGSRLGLISQSCSVSLRRDLLS